MKPPTPFLAAFLIISSVAGLQAQDARPPADAPKTDSPPPPAGRGRDNAASGRDMPRRENAVRADNMDEPRRRPQPPVQRDGDRPRGDQARPDANRGPSNPPRDGSRGTMNSPRGDNRGNGSPDEGFRRPPMDGQQDGNHAQRPGSLQHERQNDHAGRGEGFRHSQPQGQGVRENYQHRPQGPVPQQNGGPQNGGGFRGPQGPQGGRQGQGPQSHAFGHQRPFSFGAPHSGGQFGGPPGMGPRPPFGPGFGPHRPMPFAHRGGRHGFGGPQNFGQGRRGRYFTPQFQQHGRGSNGPMPPMMHEHGGQGPQGPAPQGREHEQSRQRPRGAA